MCQTIAEYERLVREGYEGLECKRIETIDEWERQVAEANRQREAWEGRGDEEEERRYEDTGEESRLSSRTD